MSRNLTLWLLGIVVLLGLASPAQAQHYRAPGSPQFSPFIEPNEFTPDLQFFSPAEWESFGGDLHLKTGWFFRYDRLYVNVTRANSLSVDFTGEFTQPWEGDFTWGNLWEFGFMTDEDHGWFLTAWHIDGPNVIDDNGYFGELDITQPPQQQGGGGGGGGQQPQPPSPQEFGPLYEFLNLDRQARADIGMVEVNKIWRLDPLHNGGVIEPFIGMRFIKITDLQKDFSPVYTDDDGDPTTPDAYTENNLFQQRTENNILGGQIGARWFVRKRRWILSTEGRAFCGTNWQFSKQQSYTQPTGLENQPPQQQGGGGGTGGGTGGGGGQQPQPVIRDPVEPVPPSQQITNIYSEFNQKHYSVVPMGEIRFDASYEVTRDISLNVGATMMYFGRGIARVDPAPFEFGPRIDFDNRMFVGGLLFGVQVNH